MQIETKPYGSIEISDRQIVTLKKGLFGFDGFHRFALLDSEQPPFYWFQSLDDKEIAFVLVSPYVFRPDYNPGIPSSDIEALGAASEEDEDLLVFVIVTIPEEQTRMTANLQGPVVINRKSRVGRQIISNDERWQVRHLIMEEMKHVGDTAC